MTDLVPIQILWVKWQKETEHQGMILDKFLVNFSFRCDMTISFNDVRGFTLTNATEDLGLISDFYFDDQLWAGRYLVVETGSWFSSNQILVSLADVLSISVEDRTFKTGLSKADIKQAPPISSHQPVSEQKRQQWYLDANATTYLIGALGTVTPALMYLQLPSSDEASASAKHQASKKDQHLRSAKEVIGYSVTDAQEQTVGSVADIILQDDSSTVEYLVIDTGNWLPGQLVVVAPQWSEEISWSSRTIKLAMPKETIENAPALASVQDLHQSYRESIYAHYGYPLF